MQRHIKTRLSSEGKMLSGHVKRYMNERSTFDTKVCSYKFGMDLNGDEAVDIVDGTVIEDQVNNYNGQMIKFPTSGKRSIADR